MAQTKAAHYLQQLDAARCEADWDALPELIRKVRKHAPDRVCLTLTAETEHAISIATQKQSSTPRPSTAVSAKELHASTQVPKLLEAIDAEFTHIQDKFQARVCTGWLHWVVGEYNLASVRLPKTLEPEYSQIDNFDNASEWTRVCALKAAYLRANCLIRANQRFDALDLFDGALPPLSSSLASQQGGKQIRYWSELLLTEFCMNVSQAFEDGDRTLEDPNCLSSYRAWAKYWEGSTGQPLQGGYGFSGSVPRRRVWYDYYSALSSIVEEDLPSPTGNAPLTAETNAKSRLRVELKKVEAAYEALLLSETQFPKAEEEREEVESFIGVVMSNWTAMGGRSWKEHDLGQGGRESLSRGVLDILYRAATKTYHSTAILRHLFTVNLAVAEFDLAFKAFDSYLDIVTKGKARVEKTGHMEPSLDSDADFVRTISQCVTALCRYGDRAAAERARDLGQELERWVEKLAPAKVATSVADGRSSTGNGEAAPEASPGVPLDVLAFAWQAIGMSQAQWSRMTFDADARTEIQAKAVWSLKRSLSSEYGCSSDTKGLFALGLLLAERRELSSAIEVVKVALMMNKPRPEERGVFSGCYLQERLLIPVWHLLALLMSARQDYVMAARFCEGALEQFKDPAVLFGTQDLKGHFRSEHLNEAESEGGEKAQHPPGLVDEMDDSERESILEIKMTQLTLVEVMEGPDVAVNACYELLSLFSRLFGKVETPATMKPPKSIVPMPPKSSTGTLRSITGSIFGGRSERRGRRPSFRGGNTNERMSDLVERPLTMQTTASGLTNTPAIQVTGENGLRADSSSQRRSSHAKRSESARRGNSLRKRDSSKKRAVSSSGSRKPTLVDGDAFFTPAEDIGEAAYDFFTFSSKRQASSSSIPQPTRSLSYLSSGGASNGGLSDASGATTRLPITMLPVIQFSKAHEKRRRMAILIKVWLMIAGFYRRAHMLNDCREAIGEAQKYTQLLEKDVARDATGGVTIGAPGWAGEKSVEQLHGDCWAELGNLALLKEQPYTARADFEAAITHFSDHPNAIIGLSNILLDVYSEKLLPDPAVPPLHLPGTSISSATTGVSRENIQNSISNQGSTISLPCGPLGLGGGTKPADADGKTPGGGSRDTKSDVREMLNQHMAIPSPSHAATTSPALGVSFVTGVDANLPPPYKAKSIPMVDRLAARDRAYGLLSGLTKLGTGWNNAEAWFTLARAHEESGQPDKATDVLWWCVELEEGTGARAWADAVGGGGGYVL